MKTTSEVRDTFCDGSMQDSGKERLETISIDTEAVRVMSGRAASAGTAIGRAVVVLSKDDMLRVKEGTVIVSDTASPKLGVVIPNACAIVTELGGLGAAASCFARQYGIPAVVGVAGLTKVVKNGDLLRVDGLSGTVKIIKA
jgi:pyruvate,water dikinase